MMAAHKNDAAVLALEDSLLLRGLVIFQYTQAWATGLSADPGKP